MTTILLHGIGGPSWDGMIPGAIDWPMPGFCGTAPLPEMTFPALADSLRDALDARGLDRVTLVGHSMGGMLAQEFVARCPERVAKLVLYGTTPAFGGRDPSFAEQFLAARLGPLEGRSMQDAAPDLMAGMLADSAPPDALPRALAAMRAIPEEVYRATLRCLTTFDRRADMARIAVPTLLIAGERDQAAPLKTMQRMAEAIPGARIVVVPGAGHLIHLEAPEPFRAALLPFLKA
ncbi:alpha/beta hydrolase [Roseomonas frigidaquae]|uniref:Alpha/beta hydrolase n=1 Tax=Falsiroseomonas frigidaquae TaxID=487318 RepID=A0ABX1EX77_9PROT|nr:alpha/beta hydrolase [Falsiroseomonas frigidaquae]NKE44659.1 alpha/beta hydrolase [Falsiroseomonas frigidaquae]